jgi:hypothetical protein
MGLVCLSANSSDVALHDFVQTRNTAEMSRCSGAQQYMLKDFSGIFAPEQSSGQTVGLLLLCAAQAAHAHLQAWRLQVLSGVGNAGQGCQHALVLTCGAVRAT